MPPSSPPPPGVGAEMVPPWLKSLPLAPEFHPTAAEFADPIAYILKIEPSAAPFGICKVVPPCPMPPRKTTLSNLSRSFAALHPDDPAPSFPTRYQQLGLCPRRSRPALKPVWRSSHTYTLPQFESKASASRKPILARLNVPASKHLSPLEYEALFWRASVDRPVTVDYASDMQGSGFSLYPGRPSQQEHVGATAWNMRAVARSPGSLLRFMREEVPGVNTPMLYVAMLFSWFAWHVEDHDLHSLNYLHFGAAKTWYGVPRDAALAFEEVVRVHGYGGEVNSLETFATLSQKTTVMSPEVLVGQGIPCCRLVQNAGEFVVTFPGSYHCGFSHGFNCGEASNIATPEWLRVAKEAAIRRASVNRPPMISHYQLLYELALSMSFREPSIDTMEPRSSRLKEKKKSEGGQLVKRIFVQNAIEDNEMLSHLLHDGSSCIILPMHSPDGPVISALHSRSHIETNSKFSDSLCSSGQDLEALACLPLNGTLDRNGEIRNCSAFSESLLSVCQEKKFLPARCTHDCVNMSSSSDTRNAEGDKADVISVDGLLDQGLLSCVSCGILSFSCVAVVKPRGCAANYLMSSDYNLINDKLFGSGGSHLTEVSRSENSVILRPDCEPHGSEILPDTAPPNRYSALDLLASAYGDQSDSDEDILKKMLKVSHGSRELLRHTNESRPNSSSIVCFDGMKMSSTSNKCQQGSSSQSSHCIGGTDIPNGPRGVRTRNKYQLKMALSEGFQAKGMYHMMEKKVQCELTGSDKILKGPCDASGTDYDASFNGTTIAMGDPKNSTTTMINLNTSILKPDKDSSRLHVFCLEHAVEVEKQLKSIGGANIILLCRPEYLKIEAEARSLAAEMEVEYDWKDIHFKEANKEDMEMIQEVLRDEEAVPTISDWSVKLGVNLYYSANLAKSPLYSKQIPYNRIIYRVFGCNSPNNSPVKLKNCERRQGRQKKIVFSGRWCGKVWMSNQVHPYLADRIENRQLEETDGICSYHLDNSSRTEASKRNNSTISAVTKASKKRDNSTLEETNTKRPKQTEEFNSNIVKCVAEVSSSPARMALRSSSRIANRKNKLKSEMKEDDDDPAGHPKPNITCHLRARPTNQKTGVRAKEHFIARATKQKTEVEAKKKTKKTRGEKRMTPATSNDEEESTSATTDCSITSDTKQELYLHKQRTRIISKMYGRKSTAVKRTPRAPKHEEEYLCNIDGCSMHFGTKEELSLHKQDICPVKGCEKKFFSHKYLLQHRRVHVDDRPLKCPWKGCDMAFKWAWARTEHLRVHTGDRPYVCQEPGCALTFRFVSDFSRHKRKAGHLNEKMKTENEPPNQ